MRAGTEVNGDFETSISPLNRDHRDPGMSTDMAESAKFLYLAKLARYEDGSWLQTSRGQCGVQELQNSDHKSDHLLATT